MCKSVRTMYKRGIPHRGLRCPRSRVTTCSAGGRASTCGDRPREIPTISSLPSWQI